jgi:hydroxyacylglutathione hydrolase
VHGADDRIPALSHKVAHNDRLNIGSIKVTCLFTPCHTTGHICYYVQPDERDENAAVFTGDTLFIGGCGRFFEGTAEQMYQNLIKTLGSLPPQTVGIWEFRWVVSVLGFSLFVALEGLLWA